ncbi:ImmA/IrrE family metallo-endopeptidase [Pseudomonas aeruginosa]|nr:ImmA/IrrE family metallo-endopeptidase [Pseudomonas aeruginosa]
MPIKTARAILDRYWDRSIPVDPFKIAQMAGARVLADHDMPHQDLSGSFTLEGNVPTIRFNPEDARVRQRFTVAHEIAHWALQHGPAMRDNARNYSSSTAYYRERDANTFAAELLMPQEVVEWMVYSKNMTDVQEMAILLDVSGAAMHYRLQNLGLLRNPQSSYSPPPRYY